MSGILDGIRVADFSRVLAGPLATSMLADLGAEVVKLERSGTGDDTRHWGPPWTQSTSSYFESANRSKKSVEIDLNLPEDRELAIRLARSADVFIENFKSGTLDDLGLAYTDLSESNPGVVYCSISGFGSGAGSALPGYDFLVQALGGLMSITGEPDGQPSKVGVALVDVLTSKDAVSGILAALYEREHSGAGQHVEVNLLSTLLGSLANQASSYLATGTPPGRMGNQHPSIAPYETLRCSDGLLAICCGNDAQFTRLLEVIGRTDLAEDPRFAHNSGRVQHRDELIPLLEDHFATASVSEWSERLGRVGVPAGAVGDIGSAFRLADDLGLAPRVATGEHELDQVRHPITYSRTPVQNYTRPPRLGEHNDDIRATYAPEGNPLS